MSKEIYCDGCGDNLSYADNSIDYRLHLVSERILLCDGPVTDVMRYPSIKRDHHFCNLECLRNWLNVKPSINESIR